MKLRDMFEDKETKGFIIGFVASVATSVISLIIFYDYFAEKAAERAIINYKKEFGIMNQSQYTYPTQQIYSSHPKGMFKMSPNLINLDSNNIESSSLELSITTCEFDDNTNTWIPVLTHTFHGNSEEEIANLIDAHKETDSFFRASFEGVFSWKGGSIKLRNVESNILYS